MSDPKNILIVGGAGFIGSHMAKKLKQEGFLPVVLDNLSTGSQSSVSYGPFVKGDYGDFELVRKTLKSHQISTVMHFGAKALVGESVENPLLYYRENVGGTIALLSAMKEVGVREIVFSSTCATFGVPKQIPISENLPQDPINPYGRSKLMVEQILKDLDALSKIQSAVLRYFNAAGCDPDLEIGENHDPETHLIPKAIRVLLGVDSELVVFGNDYPTNDGSCIRDYVHVNDLADAHLLAMKKIRETKKSCHYNLGSEKGYTVFEVINSIEKVSGQKLKYKLGPRRAGDPPVLIGDSSKAKKELKWLPKLGLEEIVKHTYEYQKKRFEK